MSLLRFVGRLLYATYFVSDGYQLLTRPDQHVDKLAPTLDRVVPSIQAWLPPDAADRVPEDARTWTRLLGVTQILGGLAYAIGIGRRTGALLLTTASVPRLIAAAEDRHSGELLTRLALLGAGIVAAQDTHGRPGLAWRAEQSRRALEQRTAASGRDLQRAGKGARKTAKAMGKGARKTAKVVDKVVAKANRRMKEVLN